MDVVSKSKRSEMMSGIKSINTKPEIIVRKYLFSKGYRYRKHQKIYGIKPDLVLKKWNLCLFIHGCYWHQHNNCKLASRPKTNLKFWDIKFKKNYIRDEKSKDILLYNKWNVGIIWECSIRNKSFFKLDLVELFKKSGFWSCP